MPPLTALTDIFDQRVSAELDVDADIYSAAGRLVQG
jgi:hypothetical protein